MEIRRRVVLVGFTPKLSDENQVKKSGEEQTVAAIKQQSPTHRPVLPRGGGHTPNGGGWLLLLVV
jgi:hypothetical protein